LNIFCFIKFKGLDNETLYYLLSKLKLERGLAGLFVNLAKILIIYYKSLLLLN
jgi:hypothetical protein